MQKHLKIGSAYEISSYAAFALKKKHWLLCYGLKLGLMVAAPFGPTHPSLAWCIFRTRFAFPFPFWSLFTCSEYCLLWRTSCGCWIGSSCFINPDAGSQLWVAGRKLIATNSIQSFRSVYIHFYAYVIRKCKEQFCSHSQHRVRPHMLSGCILIKYHQFQFITLFPCPILIPLYACIKEWLSCITTDCSENYKNCNIIIGIL